MLLFEDDAAFRQETAALFLQAQAQLGLGAAGAAEKLLTEVLRRDPGHAPAADLRAELSCAAAAGGPGRRPWGKKNARPAAPLHRPALQMGLDDCGKIGSPSGQMAHA